MISAQLKFECFDNTSISAVEQAINFLLEAYRNNGQILGREFPIAMNGPEFTVRVLLSDDNALNPRYMSAWGKKALNKLADAKLLQPRVKVLGQDINSEQASPNPIHWQILYTSYVHQCSPLRNGDDLLPIPLQHIPATFNGDHKQIIRWQTSWQACDEVQMAGDTDAEFGALYELQNVNSKLFIRGWDLRGRIEYITKIPTYYYQYHVGDHTIQEARARTCPKCGSKDWLLDEPLHDIFHFKCDDCRIVSNLSWEVVK